MVLQQGQQREQPGAQGQMRPQASDSQLRKQGSGKQQALQGQGGVAGKDKLKRNLDKGAGGNKVQAQVQGVSSREFTEYAQVTCFNCGDPGHHQAACE